MFANDVSLTSAATRRRRPALVLPRLMLASCVAVLGAFALGGCAADDGEGSLTHGADSLETARTAPYTAFIALGDSYTSGVGAPKSKTDKTCGRSDSAWPLYLHATLPSMPTLTFKACSGATTLNVMPVGTPMAGNEPINKVDDTVPQIEAIQNLKDPANTLVTFTIGGNDATVSKFMIVCTQPKALIKAMGLQDMECSAAAISKRLVDFMKPNLETTFRAMRAAAPGADIVAVGYPNLVAVEKDPGCAKWKTLPDAKRTIIRGAIKEANGIISKAAEDAGIHSIIDEVTAAFDGHEACAAKPNYINGYTPLTRMFHPNVAGNEAYALAVQSGLKRLGLIDTQAVATQRIAEVPTTDVPPTTQLPANNSAAPNSNPTTTKPTATPTANKPTAKPTADKPTNAKPTADAGITGGSAIGDPGSDDSTTDDDPSDNDPSDNDPSDNDPSDDDPSDEVPTDTDPPDEVPTDDPSDEVPTDTDPSTEDPTAEDPTTDGPTQDDPVIDDPTAEGPALDDPSTDAPSSDEPGTGDPNPDAPTAEDPTTDDPNAAQPAPDPTSDDQPMLPVAS